MKNNENTQTGFVSHKLPEVLQGVWYEGVHYEDVVELSNPLVSRSPRGYFIARNAIMAYSNGEFMHFSRESDYYKTQALAEAELMRRISLK